MNPQPAIPPTSHELPTAHGKRRSFHGWPQWAGGAVVLAALAGVSIPAFSEALAKADRAQSLAQAKQIGLALKLFAGDNDGTYPCGGTPEVLKKPTTSNAAFAVLFPTYVTSEIIFGDASSVYQTRQPDNNIDNPYTGKPVHTLEPGENVYGYMMGFTDNSNPNCPLVFDGTDGTGYYTLDAKARGGVGGGGEAIVIRLDNSGRLEPLTGPPNLLFVPLGKSLADKFSAQPDDNLLDAKFYGKDVSRLEPAIPAADKP